MADSSRTTLRTVFSLILSNIFMTAAWFGHLRAKSLSLVGTTLAAVAVAFSIQKKRGAPFDAPLDQ